jgi:hypothetical protein
MLIVVTYLFILHITKYRYTGMTVFFLTIYYRPNFPIPRNTTCHRAATSGFSRLVFPGRTFMPGNTDVIDTYSGVNSGTLTWNSTSPSNVVFFESDEAETKFLNQVTRFVRTIDSLFFACGWLLCSRGWICPPIGVGISTVNHSKWC